MSESKKRVIGTQAKPQPGHFVMTERSAHEAWGRLAVQRPRAAALMHLLCSQMGTMNAVVVPQSVMAQMMGCSIETVKRAVRDLVERRWIEVVRLGKGKEAAYVVNSRVAWGESRDKLRLSVFSATVIADFEDQDADALSGPDLRRIPTLYPGERQLAAGPGEPPPSQPAFDGMEPDLPALTRSHPDSSR